MQKKINRRIYVILHAKNLFLYLNLFLSGVLLSILSLYSVCSCSVLTLHRRFCCAAALKPEPIRNQASCRPPLRLPEPTQRRSRLIGPSIQRNTSARWEKSFLASEEHFLINVCEKTKKKGKKKERKKVIGGSHLITRLSASLRRWKLCLPVGANF